MASIVLMLAMTSSEAILTVLNTASAVSPAKFSDAEERIEQDAMDGKPLQQFVLGITTKDKELSKSMLDASRPMIQMMARQKNNALAWYLLSMEDNNFNYLRKAADGGNVQAMNALGSIAIQRVCQVQDSTPTNQIEAVLTNACRYFQRAALAKDPNGFINLGTCYQRGFGCRQNLRLAFECYQAAAKLGHPEGMDYMSACYELGHGVQISLEKSLYWKMKARAVRGDEAAAKWVQEQNRLRDN